MMNGLKCKLYKKCIFFQKKTLFLKIILLFKKNILPLQQIIQFGRKNH